MADDGRPDVAAVMAGLKPFQRDTVEHVFRQLYLAPGGSNRFLVSDEVGLGKTLVARGVIAKAIDHLWPQLPKIDRIDVVYICSNGHIARQNINRLNVMGDGTAAHATRVTMLPVELEGLRKRKVNFVSFTPGSSFDLRSSMGKWEERVLLYWMLRKAWRFGDGAAPKNVFQGWVTYQSTSWFRDQIARFPEKHTIDRDLAHRFKQALKERCAKEREQKIPDMRKRFRALCKQFARTRKNVPPDHSKDRANFIGDLRRVLAESCIKALEPDLVILDEFQRFKHLLSADDDAGLLASELLEYKDKYSQVRVLLLSATPYKMYTLHAEAASDDHYRDFLHTLRFLIGNGDGADRVAEQLQRFRREVYRAAVSGAGRLIDVKHELENTLSKVMVRTERLASTKDGSGMVHEVPSTLPALTVSELVAYPALERLSGLLDAGGMLEYWKSAPYLLNFMQGYKVKRQLKRGLSAAKPDPQLVGAVSDAQHTLLSWPEIEAYGEVDPGNVRLRALVQDTLGEGLWRLLWMPPAMPYYRPGGAYGDLDVRKITKRLVFSGWAVVPRTVSAILSYANERRRFRSYEENPENTREARKRRTPLLQFAVSEGRRTGMPVLSLLYPAISLSLLGDAVSLMAGNSDQGLPTRDSILKNLRMRLEPAVKELVRRYGSEEGSEDESWYWAAPMLLDIQEHREIAHAWLDLSGLADSWAGRTPDDEEEQAEKRRWVEHVDAARNLIENPHELGRPPADLLPLMAEIALASPAPCALRSLARVSGGVHLSGDVDIRTSAAQVGWAFRSLFNRPSVMALVRGLYDKDGMPYWRQALRYCADGVLQSVLDEYAHVLRDSLGLRDHPPADVAQQMADEISGALAMRTALLGVDDLDVKKGAVNTETRRMRLSFAMSFGDHRDEGKREGVRQEQVRSAFNSPFRPFVLATTSVGQEGLDFHQYCHAVVHWNLPSNPVDLEQREGRVHRYKCHAVRKNVAAVYSKNLKAPDGSDMWEELFQLAMNDVADTHDGMVPFWVFDPVDGCCIERHVPALPLSRDQQRYEDLRRSLAVYRMVFGQPRQEDLLAYLVNRVDMETLESLKPHLQIDLRPRSDTQNNGQSSS